jgi:basic membrane protein A and related proteins
MTRDIGLSRRAVIASGIAVGVSALATAARAAAPMKVAGIHASPVENAWNSCLHQALQDAAKQGAIDYVFSEGVSGTDYPRAMREYAEQGNKLIIGEAYAVEKEARQVAADYPNTAFVLGSSGGWQNDQIKYRWLRRRDAYSGSQHADQCVCRWRQSRQSRL